MLGSPQNQPEEAVFRAPENLRGLTLHTVGGMLTVPPRGIVHVAARPAGHDQKCDCAKCSMHRDLRGRGFREERAQKAADPLDEIKRVLRAGALKAQLVGIARRVDPGAHVGGDVYRWLSQRAEANEGVRSWPQA